MKHLVVAALLLVGFNAADVLRFAPEEKSSVEKLIRTELQFSATDVAMSVDGVDLPKQKTGDFVLKFREVTQLKLTDRYVKTGDGRPIELDRTFDELTKSKNETQKLPVQAEETVQDTSFESGLEAKTVRFSWREKTDAYESKFAGEDADAGLLVGLAEDTDFRALLPKSDANVGDTWKLEGEKFSHLLDIGGNLHFIAAEKTAEDEDDHFGRQVGANMSGESNLEFVEIREKDGLRLAVIEFKAEFKSHAEMEKATLHADVTLKPEGKLLWDLALNRMHSLEVEGQIAIVVTGDQNIGGEGDAAHKLHIQIQMDGTFAVEAATKAP